MQATLAPFECANMARNDRSLQSVVSIRQSLRPITISISAWKQPARRSTWQLRIRQGQAERLDPGPRPQGPRCARSLDLSTARPGCQIGRASCRERGEVEAVAVG